MATPWHDDFVYFEAQTAEVVAFEPHDDGVIYTLLDFAPGVYRLPLDAIRPATAADRRRRVSLVSVDACQVYFVDRSRSPASASGSTSGRRPCRAAPT